MSIDLIDIRSGVKSRPLFSSEEMFRRLRRVRQLIERQGLDALLLSEPASIAYYANLVPQDASQPVLLLLTQERSITLTALDEGGYAYRHSFGESLAYRDVDHLAEGLRQLLPEARTLGVEAWHLPAALGGRLKAAMPQLRGLRALDSELWTLREVLGEEELALLHQAAGLAERGMALGYDALQAGLSEAEWSAQARLALVQEAQRRYHHLDSSRSDLRLLCGPFTDGRGNPPGARWIEPGDLLDLACCVDLAGYRVEVSRSLLLQQGSAAQRERLEQVREAHLELLGKLRPGPQLQGLLEQAEPRGKALPLRHHLLPGSVLSRGFRPAAKNQVCQVGGSALLVSELLIPDGHAAAGGYRFSTPLLWIEEGCRALVEVTAAQGRG